MGAYRGYYGLIQYCPDPSRAEAANVGVFLFCPDLGFLAARTAEANDRVRRFFRGEGLDLARIQIAKRAIEARLRRSSDEIRTVEDLNRFIETRANELRLTPPRPMRITDPNADLDALFKELVGGRARREPLQPLIPELDELLRTPDIARRIQFDQRVEVPVLGFEIRIPYVFRNGIVNLVKPHRFPDTDEGATSNAMRLAVEGDLLHRHADDVGIKRVLTVVAVFGTDMETPAGEKVRAILGEFSTKMVSRSQVPELIEQIKREAH